jgi:predicted MFS family arabinose efflux permease
MIITRIPLTLLSKKIGENRMFIIAFLVQMTTPLLYYLTPNPFWLYFIPFYQVIATGSFNQLAMSRASDMAPNTRQGDALGRYMTFMSSGMFIGPLISSALLISLSYRELFLVTSIFPLIALLLFIRYGRIKPAEIREEEPESPSSILSLKEILREKNVLILTLIRTTYSLSNTIFTTLFAVYATQNLGFSESVVALLFSVLGFTNAFVKIPAGLISDRIGAKRVLLAAFTTVILVFLSISYVRSFLLFFVTFIFFGLSWGTRAVTEWANLANTVSQENKAIAMSYLGSIWGLGATVGNILSGLFAANLPYSMVFLIAAVINIPALPAIAMLEKPNNGKQVN